MHYFLFAKIISYCDDVKSRFLLDVSRGDVLICGCDYMALLLSGNEFFGISKRIIFSCFNFHKNDIVLVFSYYINFFPPVSPVSFDYFETQLYQMRRSR